jgi:hypothetical protein
VGQIAALMGQGLMCLARPAVRRVGSRRAITGDSHEQDKGEDWQRGYDAAMNARPYVVPSGIKDQAAFARGYAEGTAARKRAAKEDDGKAG